MLHLHSPAQPPAQSPLFLHDPISIVSKPPQATTSKTCRWCWSMLQRTEALARDVEFAWRRLSGLLGLGNVASQGISALQGSDCDLQGRRCPASSLPPHRGPELSCCGVWRSGNVVSHHPERMNARQGVAHPENTNSPFVADVLPCKH